MSSFDDFMKDNRVEKEVDNLLENRTPKKTEKQDKKIYDKPVWKSDKATFTKEEIYETRKKFSEGKDRKEKKRIMMGEKSGFLDRQKTVMMLFAISICAIFFLFYYFPANESLLAIIIIIGSMMFLPIGMILGWAMLDPFMRCKIMRKMSGGRKNYGIINFVAKGKKIISKIKNFDDDLIWIKNKCWVLSKGGIYEIDKTGERINEGTELDPDSVMTVTETVPTMFIDLTSLEPLTFIQHGREPISPEEMGSFLKGWTDNQMSKMMFLKKTLDMYFIIVIISCLASAFFSYQNSQSIEELKLEIESLKSFITGT